MHKIKEKSSQICTNPWFRYYVKTSLVSIELFGVMAILSYLFDNWYFAIISSIIICTLQKYTYNFHFKGLWRCNIMSNTLIVIFGYIAKESVDYLWVVFFIALLSIRDIWLNLPLKDMDKKYKQRWYNRKHFSKMLRFLHINTTKWDVPYDKKYCQKKFGQVLLIIIIIILTCLYINEYYIINCILWSFILLKLLYFINDSDW